MSSPESDSPNSFRISSSAESSTTPTVEEVESGARNADGYTGYHPLTAADFPDITNADDSSRSNFESKAESDLLIDNSRRSLSLSLLIAVLGISFVACVVWQVLIASCTVTKLCETNDQSSESSVGYLFKTFLFRVPSALVWIGLTAGSLCLIIAAIWAYNVLRREVCTVRMAEISTIMRTGANAFVAQHYIALIVPVGIVFILLGFGVNWKMAGCFVIGSFTSILAVHAALSIVSRGQARIPEYGDDAIRDSLYISFRTGATANLFVLAVAIITSSALYLMFSDIRALSGLSAGVTTVGLFATVTSAVFSRAANKSVFVLDKTERRDIALKEPRAIPWMVGYIASGVGSITATAADFLSSIVCAILATAILGSSLPFFYRDSFAVCVFNHLSIDQECGPFGYPEVLSYATYICNNNKLYLQYPSLKTWASNSVFVAIPFVIGAVGLLVSMVCSLYVRFTMQPISGDDPAVTAVMHARRISMISRRLRINIICGYMLFIICCIAVIFGLLGGESEFQEPNGFGREDNLLQMQLNGSERQCVPKFLNSDSASIANPLPVPQGGELKLGKYHPVSIFGVQLSEASSTPWRLMGCVLIGTLLSWLTIEVCSGGLTYNSTAAAKRLLRIIDGEGKSVGMLQATSNSLLYILFPAILVLISVLSAHMLYGAYGIGIMTVGFLSSGGCCISISMMGHVATNASYITYGWSETLGLFGSKLAPVGTSLLNNASILTSVTLVLVVLQESNVLPSPRELIGSPEQPPNRLISSTDGPTITNMSTGLSLFVGIIIPFILCGIVTLSSSATSDWFLKMFGIRVPTRTRSKLFSKIVYASMFNSLIPITLCVVAPIVAGFIHGVKGLVSFLASLAGTSYILSCLLSTLAISWDGMQRWIKAYLVKNERKNAKFGRRPSSDLPAQEVSALRDCMMPVLVTCSKTMAAIGLVCVQVMALDKSRAWVGYVVGGVWILGSGALVTVKTFLNRKWKQGDEEQYGEDLHEWSERVVSPFYEEGYRIDMERVAVGSEIHGKVFDMMGQTGRYGLAKYAILKNGEMRIEENRPRNEEDERRQEEVGEREI